jgi:hypothetical protein
VRYAVCLLVVLMALGPQAHAAKERDFAVGAKEVLSYAPELPSHDETAKSLKQILSRPEFDDAQAQPKGPTLLERLLQWISGHLGGLGSGLMHAGKATLVIAGIVIAAILVLLIYTLVRLIWARLSRVDEPQDLEFEENLTAIGFRELARKAAIAGEYRAALRYRFRAVVGELDVLDPDRQTNWQLLRHVRRTHTKATPDFAELVALFEDAWYGGRTAGIGEYRRAEQLSLAIEKELTLHEAAA